MRIAEIKVPKGCDVILVDLENGGLMVTYGSSINKREVFNQYTMRLEELPGIGDMCVMWNDEERDCAVVCTMKDRVGQMYRGNNKCDYGNAVKFRDNQQFLEIRGIYGKE